MSEKAKLPIDRPCSACSGGDSAMKYHDHSPPFRANVLTPCELRVLQLSAEGYSCADVALMLGIVVDTVKHHRCNLMNKLGAENMANAVYIGLKTAIIA